MGFDEAIADTPPQAPQPAVTQPQAPSNPQSNPQGGFDEAIDDSVKYGSSSEMAKTGLEQGLSGATLGLSKVFETHGIPELGISPLTTPEAIAGRERENPITATVGNIAGTSALIYGTGGLGAIAKSAQTLKAAADIARNTSAIVNIAKSALAGAGIAGATQITDDWSQNKPLDAQKIIASAGIGSLLGGAGGLLAEGIAGKFKPLAQVPNPISKQSNEATEAVMNAANAPVHVPELKKGIQPTDFEELSARVKNAQENGTAIPLPQQSELDDAISRVGLENPVHPLQRDALGSQQANDIYKTAKEAPGEVGPILNNHEALQKSELIGKTAQTIQEISPTHTPIPDAYEGGKYAIDAFTNQYQAEKKALGPIFQQLKSLPVPEHLLLDSVNRMTTAVPEIAGMFDMTGQEIAIRPFNSSMGMARATYNGAKEVIEGLQSQEKPNFQTLWNVRKGLDSHVDVLSQDAGAGEIRSLKASLMNQMMDTTGDPTIRDTFKRYAVNEQQRHVIEKSFGASVGSPEFGQISKVKPEMIGDKIFGNSATTEAAKNILPPEQFQSILANWLSEAKAKVTDNAKSGYSSHRFASFLKSNQDALNMAFQGNEPKLQRLKDLTTIARILPDAVSINPSGTAKTLSRMILANDVHNLTWEGMLASLPKKALALWDKHVKMNELNAALSGQAMQNSRSVSLQKQVAQISDEIQAGVKTLFQGSASESRKYGK